MRIVEKLLYGVGGLLALVLLFILLCHYKPELAKDLGETIQANAKESQNTEQEETKEETESPKSQLGSFDVKTALDGTVVLPISTKEYVAPVESLLSVPSWAEQKNGLTDIQAEGTEITEKEAEQLFDTLGTGNIGKGLNFDAVTYPYYHMLDETGKAIYRQIYANANSMIKEFAPVEAIADTLLKNAFMAVVNDHPELFWVNTEYEYKYAPTGQIAGIYLSFNKTAKDMETSKIKFETAANTIISEAQNLENAHDKELYVHDELTERISYSKSAPMNQSAYSALVEGKTVCAGYARAFQYIMQRLGIPCYYCTGFAGENHAWNIIKLEDGYYNVDVTWADTNPNNYLYFNGTDVDYAKDHIRRNLSVKLPACNGERYRLCEVEYVEEEVKKPESTSKEDDTVTSGEQQTVKVIRTLEQVGFQYEDLIRSIEDYYADCSNTLVNTHNTKVTFRNVVKDAKLWKEIMKSYEEGNYETAYMNRLLTEKHLSGAKITVTGEELADGSFLITHEVVLQ